MKEWLSGGTIRVEPGYHKRGKKTVREAGKRPGLDERGVERFFFERGGETTRQAGKKASHPEKEAKVGVDIWGGSCSHDVGFLKRRATRQMEGLFNSGDEVSR